MNWKAEAVTDLKNYLQRKESVENLNRRIKILDEQFVSLHGISTEERVMGGKPQKEEKWLENISERERLNFNLKIAEEFVRLTEKGLAALEDRERQVLEGFYIQTGCNHIDTLCERLSVEKSTLYRIKDEALRRFTIGMYGAVEI